MRLLLYFCLLAPACAVTAQSTAPSARNESYDEIPPRFKAGDKMLMRIIADSMRYPPAARQDRIGGKIVVEFIVDTAGNIRAASVVEGIRSDLDQEAIRLVNLLNGWHPGIQNGKKVNVQFRLPLYFYPDPRFRRQYKKAHQTGPADN
ncbi:energy transducer TonB [Chitinophaga alhagiae]|uniref:energy transducer TonB n=1 Tax=Chitinophaga alhagiae TaxID=2203219 RepID=UPI001ABF4A11|nr:energy transducer TonB [Chitinophaga alhagiae]